MILTSGHGWVGALALAVLLLVAGPVVSHAAPCEQGQHRGNPTDAGVDK